MTVPLQPNKKQYIGNGEFTDFPIPFRFIKKEDIVVILTDLNNRDFPQEYITDYDVIGIEDPANGFTNGTVIMNIAPPTSYKLTVTRSVNTDQTTDYSDLEKFPAKSHEGALDKQTMILQDLEEILQRTLALDITSTEKAPVLENLSGNAGKALIVNQNASGIEYQTIFPGTALGNFPKNQFSGDGIETDFILSYIPIIENTMIVSVDSVLQEPGVDFNVIGDTLSFTTPPPIGINNIWALDHGKTTDVNVPADGSVTTVKLATGAVTTEKIADGAVTADKIADNSITSSEIQDNAVITDKIQDFAVTSDKIEDDAITNVKILNNAVNNAKIENGAVSISKVDNDVNKGIAKAWVYFDGRTDSPNVIIRNSFNISDVQRTGIGNYSILFDNQPPDANYIAVVSGNYEIASASQTSQNVIGPNLFSPITQRFHVTTGNSENNTALDFEFVYAVFYW